MPKPKPNPMSFTERASLGGKARARKLSKAKRKAIAKKAAQAKWGKSRDS